LSAQKAKDVAEKLKAGSVNIEEIGSLRR